MKRLKLKPYDHIIAAFADPAVGPGWSNTPVWIVVRSQFDGSHRLECIQPHQQTADMVKLYRINAETHRAMTEAARIAVYIPKGEMK